MYLASRNVLQTQKKPRVDDLLWGNYAERIGRSCINNCQWTIKRKPFYNLCLVRFHFEKNSIGVEESQQNSLTHILLATEVMLR